MPAHHPGPELLMDYAGGALPEPVALLLASHVALCADCRAKVSLLEALGGVLLEELEDESLAATALDATLARLDTAQAYVPRCCGGSADPVLPAPLAAYLPDGLDALPWKRRGSVAEADLLPGFPGIRTRLLRVKAGGSVPQHGHEGNEYVLLLAGGFSDQTGHYRRGDVALADPAVEHRPVADAGEDCLCLFVTDAPLRLTGPIGRFLNRFVTL